MKDLGLEHVAHVRIGSELSWGISGGEKHRVSIGVDLVHDPAVLLIYEPTSGLDSASALHVVLLLKSMAIKQGKIIVLTIHQPGSQILELFYQILLLSKGTVLHQGPLHLLEQQLRFVGHSIAIEVTEALVIHIEDNEIKDSDAEQDHEHIRKSLNLSSVAETIIFYPNGQYKEVLILIQKFSNIICRTNQLFAARILQAVLAGFVLGTVFMNATNEWKTYKLQT